MAIDAKDICRWSGTLFEKKRGLLDLHQEIAEHFYPERADFTATRYIGKDFAANLTTSYPVIVRRELGNAIASMLRPRTQEWFQVSVDRSDKLDRAGKRWLERATGIQRRDMYSRESQFVRATKEGDHDFATFGQCVIQVGINWNTTELIFRTHHLRDCAWVETGDGKVGAVFRKWKPTLRQAYQTFKPDSMHVETKRAYDKNKDCEHEFLHVAMPLADYDSMGGAATRKMPWRSIWIDPQHNHIIEDVGSNVRGYVIPRFQTVSGSQYAFSPATVAGLPDARLLQAMALTLLEAGEMAVRPPMVGQKDVVRQDVQLFAGGITWVDKDYDERLGEALRPLAQDKTGLPFGLEMTRDTRELLSQAFFLNKLALPQIEKEMTAYEANQRMQEYVRGALPLFEPAEAEYNGALCEDVFTLLMSAGRFGPLEDIPDSIRGQDVRFMFESPLHDALDRQKGLRFTESAEMIATAVQLDQAAGLVFDVRTALRDALDAIGAPAHWQRDDEVVEQIVQDMEAEKQANAALQQAAAGGQAMEMMGKGGKALAEAEAA